MLTYEVNIICDKCKSQCVTGEPCAEVEDAKVSALQEAQANGWKHNILVGWHCSDCVAAAEEGPQS